MENIKNIYFSLLENINEEDRRKSIMTWNDTLPF